MNPFADSLVQHMRQRTSIYGLAICIATTVALATRQITLDQAEAGYSLGLTMVAMPEKAQALVNVDAPATLTVTKPPDPK
jgi:hypothetical protein